MTTSRAGQSLNRPLEWKPEMRADISESDFQMHTNSAPILRARMSGKSSLRFAPYGKALLRERNILAERREKDCLSTELEVGRWEVVETMTPTPDQANLSCSGGNIGQLLRAQSGKVRCGEKTKSTTLKGDLRLNEGSIICEGDYISREEQYHLSKKKLHSKEENSTPEEKDFFLEKDICSKELQLPDELKGTSRAKAMELLLKDVKAMEL